MDDREERGGGGEHSFGFEKKKKKKKQTSPIVHCICVSISQSLCTSLFVENTLQSVSAGMESEEYCIVKKALFMMPPNPLNEKFQSEYRDLAFVISRVRNDLNKLEQDHRLVRRQTSH